jgi:CheY-like chemotaxis protein
MLHFLLAEDDDDHAELVLRSLRRYTGDHTVDRVADGVEALRYVRREGPYSDKPRPGLILMDLNMPRLGGHEVLRQLKDDPKLRTIPVVILSTSDAEFDRQRAYHHYANSYLVKPSDFGEFSKLVQDVSTYWGTWNRHALDQ